MNEFNSTTIDRLTRYGVLDSEFQPPTIVKEKPQTPQAIQPQENDVFACSLNPQNSKLKTYGAVGLLTYLLGIACSKGKLNPIDGAKGIFNVCKNMLLGFCKIFKKS